MGINYHIRSNVHSTLIWKLRICTLKNILSLIKATRRSSNFCQKQLSPKMCMIPCSMTWHIDIWPTYAKNFDLGPWLLNSYSVIISSRLVANGVYSPKLWVCLIYTTNYGQFSIFRVVAWQPNLEDKILNWKVIEI